MREFTDLPAVSGQSQAGEVKPRSVPSVPKQIGDYRILSVLGFGGMGVVYRAEQSHPNRQVAIKVVRSDPGSPQRMRRFEHEPHVLARLQHPAIAQVYSAGRYSTEDGNEQPYFCMELVEGAPVTTFCVSHKLNLTERLQLFAQVCDGVHHAHQKGIIHRDLKPGNIFVTNERQPKILDFGLARIRDTNGDHAFESHHTAEGQLLGTLPYVSPEQIAGSSDDVDTRSDVYALGVLLYEILTETLPYELSNRPLAEVVQIIREKQPIPLGRVDRRLRGDLETIASKALAKDRASRYQSAAELAMDVRRFLNREPISAQVPSAMHQLRAYAQRHPSVVGVVLTTFVALLVIGVTSVVLWQRAEYHRRLAEKALSDSYAKSVELASQRGKWPEALENVKRALDTAPTDYDATDLRLQRVAALIALNEVAEASSELEQLRKAVVKGSRRWASVLFWSGVVAQATEQQQKQWFEDALATGSLGDAEAAFARASIAPDIDTAVRELRATLQHDPFIPLAHPTLIVLLIFGGQKEAARIELDVAKRANPKDTNLRILEALLKILQGNVTEARLALDVPQIDDEQYGLQLAWVDFMERAWKFFDGGFDDSQAAQRLGLQMMGWFSQLQKAVAHYNEQSGNNIDFDFPRGMPCVRGSFGVLGSDIGPKTLLSDAAMSQTVEANPEGTLLFIRATNRHQANRLRDAEADYVAAQGGSMFPIEKLALFGAIMTQWSLAAIYTQNPDPEMRQKCVASIRKLVVVLESEDARSFGAEYAEPVASIAWQLHEFDLGRYVVSLYERHHSHTAGMMRMRAALDYSAGAYASAMSEAEQALRLNPPAHLKNDLENLLRMLPDVAKKSAEDLSQPEKSTSSQSPPEIETEK